MALPSPHRRRLRAGAWLARRPPAHPNHANAGVAYSVRRRRCRRRHHLPRRPRFRAWMARKRTTLARCARTVMGSSMSRPKASRFDRVRRHRALSLRGSPSSAGSFSVRRGRATAISRRSSDCALAGRGRHRASNCGVVPAGMSVQKLVDDLLLRTGRRCFLIEIGASWASITPHEVKGDPRFGGSSAVSEVMLPLAQLRLRRNPRSQTHSTRWRKKTSSSRWLRRAFCRASSAGDVLSWKNSAAARVAGARERPASAVREENDGKRENVCGRGASPRTDESALVAI